VNNLKSIGTKAKIILFIFWVVSLIGLGIIGVRQATEKAYNGDVITEVPLPIRTGDTVRITMQANNQYEAYVTRDNGVEIMYDENDQKIIYSNDIRLIVKSTTDSVARLMIDKNAEGNSFLNAKKRAEAIEYNYSFENGTLFLDGYFLTAIEHKYRDQEIELTLFLPEGTILIAEDNTYSFHRNDSRHNDILHNGMEGKPLLILKNKAECLTCPKDELEATEQKVQNSDNETWKQEVNEDFTDDTQTETKEIKIVPVKETVKKAEDSINN
jgi:ToastRack found in some PspC